MSRKDIYALRWTSDSIRWYMDAAASEPFFKEIAGFIQKCLPPTPRICDAGCGIGALSLELASFAKEVWAVDMSGAAIDALKEEAGARGIVNVRAIAGDFDTINPPEELMDAVVCCQFGSLEEVYERARDFTRNKLFLISNAAPKRAFSPSGGMNKARELERSVQFLERNKIPFTLDRLNLSFGQRLRDKSDAAGFLRHYDTAVSNGDIDRYLENRADFTPENEYTIYIPNIKDMALFVVDME